jgi:hypothetical protein
MHGLSWSRSREIKFAGVVTIAVVLLRIWFGLRSSFCGTPDACSYLALAESLSRHQGFRVNFVYQYQFISAHLPMHGIEYWRPGASFIMLLAQPFGGVTLHSSLVVTIFMGVLLAAAAWRIAMDFSGDPKIACSSYLLCLVLPPLWNGSLQPDSTLYYGVFAAWFLALFRAKFDSYFKDALAWFCLAILNLIRNDTILMLLPLATVLWMRHRTPGRRGASPAYLSLVILAFFAAMIPMSLVSNLVMHKVSPGATYQSLYVTDISELTNYGYSLNLHSMLTKGIRALISVRAAALPMIVYRILFLLIGCGAIFLPALAVRRSGGQRSALPEMSGGIAFAVALIAVYGLVLPGIGTFSALRSFTGLLPLTAVLITIAIGWVANDGAVRRRIVATVFLFYLIAGLMEDRRDLSDMNAIGDRDRQVAAFIEARGESAATGSVIMTADPAQFSETTGLSAIPIPNNGSEAIRQAVLDLQPGEVLLDRKHVQSIEDDLCFKFKTSELEPVSGTDSFLVPARVFAISMGQWSSATKCPKQE